MLVQRLSEVKCLLFSKELSYTNNTTCMLRQYRALNENERAQPAPSTRKHAVDQASVAMVVKDSQPFTLVEDQGFRSLLDLLEPTYIIPTRQALKAMVEERFHAEMQKAKEEVQKAKACSLTADMWTSMDMEAYLGVTCHFITEEDTLNTILLGVEHFPQSHTAENLAQAKTKIMAEWGIKD
ncbi:uncharacterized protein LOC128765169 [Synchiropus splendidus]|uniref:uncharacterized protein LOC128751744 n=1 Tax=Synchiropus splendidus TaxID=270530 RepID=UPI00237EBC8A|nr:uncharacterized protein LOC128751744 [Synchiropus splendidus]XP_053713398.1 uncharacterized protein LOC128754655 [Synchiropus splendidus]XP_053713486.1 uncharacterized protein LOC128754705 [Synchiropus splendidus]XP_053714529.1 uncharacterized protein LOC128755299 [Synchiropus splendidus]XP_053719801.1 uncharacterized protein LOC128758049 [Synchiropus splendidus]XP_053731625.1 uncharacterized protein LOC128765169 [Synchiropus splendidus]